MPPTVKELAKKLQERPEVLAELYATRMIEALEPWWASSTQPHLVADREAVARLCPPAPTYKPLRLEWEQRGKELRFRQVSLDENDRGSAKYINGYNHHNGSVGGIFAGMSKNTDIIDSGAMLYVGTADEWSKWKSFPSPYDATAFYDKARMAVYDLNTKRGCKTDLPYNTIRQVEEPYKPLRLEIERKGREVRARKTEMDPRDIDRLSGQTGGLIFAGGGTVEVGGSFKDSLHTGLNETCDWTGWYKLDSDAAAIEWCKKIGDAVRSLNASRGLGGGSGSWVSVTEIRPDKPWDPLVIAFRQRTDGRWEGQILQQDERDRTGPALVGTFAGVDIFSAVYPGWFGDGRPGDPGLRIRSFDKSRDSDWFHVDSESDVRKIQSAVRELNQSRGISLAQ